VLSFYESLYPGLPLRQATRSMAYWKRCNLRFLASATWVLGRGDAVAVSVSERIALTLCALGIPSEFVFGYVVTSLSMRSGPPFTSLRFQPERTCGLGSRAAASRSRLQASFSPTAVSKIDAETDRRRSESNKRVN
jgi:hypothetical protein